MKLIFQCINLLKTAKPQRWIFDEVNEIGKIDFQYKDKEEPIDYVTDLTTNMHHYAMPDILTADCYQTEFASELIELLLNSLVPENMKLMVISKKFENETNLTEKWYGTEYMIELMTNEQLNILKTCGLNNDLRLPEKNSFMPEDLRIMQYTNVEDIPKHPRLIHSSQHMRLWYEIYYSLIFINSSLYLLIFIGSEKIRISYYQK